MHDRTPLALLRGYLMRGACGVHLEGSPPKPQSGSWSVQLSESCTHTAYACVRRYAYVPDAKCLTRTDHPSASGEVLFHNARQNSSAQQQHAARVYRAVYNKTVRVHSRRQSISSELKVVAPAGEHPIVESLDLFAYKIVDQQTAMRRGWQFDRYRGRRRERIWEILLLPCCLKNIS